ncbi:hypothetical protein [Streptomyces sp. NPDC001781]
MRDDRDDRDDSDPPDDRRPPPRGEIQWLTPHRPHDECPWCRLLLRPADRPPGPSPDRGRTATARLRTVMVVFSALVTLVAALVALWRP